MAWTTSDPNRGRRTTAASEAPSAANTPGTTITCTVTSDGGTMAKSLSYKQDDTAPALAATLSRRADGG